MSEPTRLQQLGAEFTAYMHAGVNTLAGLGYNASRFRLMLLEDGDGAAFARRLVINGAADGLWRLAKMRRLDMSVEMWVLYPEYEELFDQSVRDQAYSKLRSMDFDVERQLRRPAEG